MQGIFVVRLKRICMSYLNDLDLSLVHSCHHNRATFLKHFLQFRYFQEEVEAIRRFQHPCERNWTMYSEVEVVQRYHNRHSKDPKPWSCHLHPSWNAEIQQTLAQIERLLHALRECFVRNHNPICDARNPTFRWLQNIKWLVRLARQEEEVIIVAKNVYSMNSVFKIKKII